ncbi:MAG: hypothetical protein EBS85_04520 [Micrococcales bacterium]|nr:hypothetical protein [Micrococcales bacterium]
MKLDAEIALLSLLWLAFFNLGSPRFAYSTQICFWLIISASAALIILQATRIRDIKTASAGVSVWALLLLVSSFAAQLLSVSLNNYNIVGDISGLLTVAFGLYSATRSNNRVLIRSFYLTSVFFVFSGWLAELTLRSESTFSAGFVFNILGRRFTGFSVHPNVIGLLCALLFAIAILEYKNYYIALLGLGTLIFSENRGGLLAVIAILAIWSLSLKNQGQKFLAISSVFAVGLGVFSLFGTLREGANDLTSGRLDIWAVCRSKIEEGRIFGFGPNTISRLYGVDTVDWFRPFHCHNQVLDDSVNYGLALAAFNLLSLLIVIYVSIKNKNWVFLAIFIVYLAAEFFESPIRLFSSAGFLWINFCFLIYFLISTRKNEDKASHQLT